MGHYPPGNFKTLHSNFDIYRNCQRIKMKFYILNIFKKFFLNLYQKFCCLIFKYLNAKVAERLNKHDDVIE